MIEKRVACVVEGHGEVEALPILLRRLAERLPVPVNVQVPTPIRVPKSKLQKAGELERVVQLAARKAGIGGGILIVLDGDDDCPADLGPRLLQRAAVARGDVPISVVVAQREYEAWFLAAAESLAGRRGLPTNLVSPPEPEAIRGAKGWLSDRMPRQRPYSETLDQPALTALLDVDRARRAPSFDKLCRDVERLLS